VPCYSSNSHVLTPQLLPIECVGRYSLGTTQPRFDVSNLLNHPDLKNPIPSLQKPNSNIPLAGTAEQTLTRSPQLAASLPPPLAATLPSKILISQLPQIPNRHPNPGLNPTLSASCKIDMPLSRSHRACFLEPRNRTTASRGAVSDPQATSGGSMAKDSLRMDGAGTFTASGDARMESVKAAGPRMYAVQTWAGSSMGVMRIGFTK